MRTRNASRGARGAHTHQSKRLQRMYKRELKGAKRELRKDSAFLAEVQLNERMAKDQDYRAKVKGIYASVRRSLPRARKGRPVLPLALTRV